MLWIKFLNSFDRWHKVAISGNQKREVASALINISKHGGCNSHIRFFFLERMDYVFTKTTFNILCQIFSQMKMKLGIQFVCLEKSILTLRFIWIRMSGGEIVNFNKFLMRSKKAFGKFYHIQPIVPFPVFRT